MNYPYDLAKEGEFERYIADVRNEPPEIQAQIAKYHYEMARLFGEAASTIQRIR